MAKDICNIVELSNYLKISVSMIRKLVRQKEIPFFRIGNRLYFDLQKINLWVEKRQKLEEKLFAF